MTQFTFRAYGNEFTAQGTSAINLMEAANRALLWNNSDSKDGAWFDTGENEMTWREGNYFD